MGLDDLSVVALGAFEGPGAEVGPGQIATWATATTDRADAYGFSWERSGKSSKHFPFDWSGPDGA